MNGVNKKKGAIIMFLYTIKLNRRRRIAMALAAALVVLGGMAFSLLATRQTAAAAVRSPKGIKTAEDRAAYLRSWGWEIPDSPAAVEELELPEKFGEEYSQYLALQAEQGFDLSKLAGKRVRRYSFDVLNYPTGEQGVTAHLLIYRNTVVGGEVSGNSFLHGLAKPDQ